MPVFCCRFPSPKCGAQPHHQASTPRRPSAPNRRLTRPMAYCRVWAISSRPAVFPMNPASLVHCPASAGHSLSLPQQTRTWVGRRRAHSSSCFALLVILRFLLGISPSLEPFEPGGPFLVGLSLPFVPLLVLYHVRVPPFTRKRIPICGRAHVARGLGAWSRAHLSDPSPSSIPFSFLSLSCFPWS